MVEEYNTSTEERMEKLKSLKKMGIEPYPHIYKRKDKLKEINQKYKNIATGEDTGEEAVTAGRIVGYRQHGKLTFVDLEDRNDKIQLQVQINRVGEDKYKLLDSIDIGDIIGVKGTVGKSKRGELSIIVDNYEILSKSLLDIPVKSGINIESRYRQRYLDLILNSEIRELFEKRTKIISSMRKYLDEKEFLEVEIPLIQPIYGGAEARPFKTYCNALEKEQYLSISPELYLKRLIVGGLERVYYIGKNFRNEGVDTTHNPEFTMMECYKAYADYFDMMELTEEMIARIAKDLLGTTEIEYQGNKINLSPPWERITMTDAVKKYANIDISNYSKSELEKLVEKEELEIPGSINKATVINALFEKYVEDKLIQPTFVIDYPKEISPLTKKHRSKEGFTERFELYINGLEFANAYSELNDPIDQKNRFEQQVSEREKGDKEAHMMDLDYVNALMYGMPPTGGLGLGIDRLVMLLTNKNSIKEVILFPMMR